MGIEVRIKKQFSNFRLDVDFSSAEKVTALLGGSGSGKSLTLQCISGILTPDTGYIAVDGRVLFDQQRNINVPIQQRGMGYLFQNYGLFETMTVYENIFVVAKAAQKETAKEVTAHLLEKMHITHIKNSYPRSISGGEKQRTTLARILGAQPQMLLLDEPFSALDSHLKWQMELVLEEVLQGFSKQVILVTHNQEEAVRFSHQVCVLDKGRSLEVAETKGFFLSPTTATGCRLSGCKNLSPIQVIGKEQVHAKAWGLTFSLGRALEKKERFLGVRAADIKLCDPQAEHGFSAQVRLVSQGLLVDTLVLDTGKGISGAYLTAEVPRGRVSQGQQSRFCIDPKDMMLFET